MSAHPSYPRTRLYLETELVVGKVIVLHEKQAHYLAQVLRVKPADEVALFNATYGEWRAVIEHVEKKTITLTLTEQLRAAQQSSDVWLVAAPLKNSKTEWVVEKVTELGVSAIVPVTTRYTVVDRIKTDRLSLIAQEASEQCERLTIPEIHPLTSLTRCLEQWQVTRHLLYADESGGGHNARELLPDLTASSLAVLIGPEGGFSDEELALLASLPFAHGLSLGPRILRADTAAIAAITLVQAWWGDWEGKPAFRK